MKNIRIWFKKLNTAKYISHLDLCRCMERAIHKAKLPFWYTEGFNPHVFLTISMPISLGYTGLRESMDVKLLDTELPYNEIIRQLNEGLPVDISVYEITEQIMTSGAIAFSAYEITLETERVSQLAQQMRDFLKKEEIIVMKRTKKGEKPVDIKPYFSKMEICSEHALLCKVVLPSSHNGSINPRLFFDAFEAANEVVLFAQTVRTDCFNEQMQSFA